MKSPLPHLHITIVTIMFVVACLELFGLQAWSVVAQHAAFTPTEFATGASALLVASAPFLAANHFAAKQAGDAAPKDQPLV